MTSPDAELRFVNPPQLEQPPGYSQVVEVRGGRLVFIAGQAGVDVAGNLVGGDNVEAQADQAFKNLSVALRASAATPRTWSSSPSSCGT